MKSKEIENKEKALLQLNNQVNERTKALKTDLLKDKIQEILAVNSEENPNEFDFNDNDFMEKYEDKVFEVPQSQQNDLYDQLSRVKAVENLALIQEIEDLKEKSGEKEELIKKQKADITLLEADLNSLALKIREKDSLMEKMQEKGKGICEDSKKFVKEITIFNEKIENIRREKDALSSKLDLAKQELEKTLKQKSLLDSEKERFIEELSQKEEKIRTLERNLDENKLKSKEKKLVENEEKHEFSKENEKLLNDQKKLIRQKNELLAGFKKLRKIIEILQKQKTHLEMAGSLGFSEDEFIKALDLPDKMLG